MTPELIKRLGREAGVYGVAVYAFVEANPDCRYDEIAAGLLMSRAQTLRVIAKLEAAGLVKRDKAPTQFGTDRPTLIRCATHLQTSVSTSETPVNIGASDNQVNTGVSQVDSIAHRDTHKPLGSTTETPAVTAQFLSDASNDGCLSQRQSTGENRGTPIAPLKAETTTTEKNSQPSVEADANAPPTKPTRTKKARQSKADPRTSHAAIRAVFEITGRRPDKDLYNKIIRTLGEDPDGQRLLECFEAWRGKGYRATNYAWITEWYVKGIPEKFLNGNGRHREQTNPRTDTIREYDYSVFNGAEGEGVGDFDSQVPPDEWVAAPSPGRPDGDDRRMVRSSRH